MFIFNYIHYLTVRSVEPVVTHQTCWLGSTEVSGMQQKQAHQKLGIIDYALPPCPVEQFLVSS